METAQSVFILIAVSPFLVWAAILYGLSIVAPLRIDPDQSRSDGMAPRHADEPSIYPADLPDVTIEHYYLHQTERTPFISS